MKLTRYQLMYVSIFLAVSVAVIDCWMLSQDQTALQHACFSAWNSIEVLPELLAAPTIDPNASAAGTVTAVQILLEQILPSAGAVLDSPCKVEAAVLPGDKEKIQTAIQLLLDAGDQIARIAAT